MNISKIALAAALIAGTAGTAAAQDWYVSGSGGVNLQDSSSNSGETGAFTTGDIGDDTTIDVAAGTAYGWDTDFDTGFVVSAETGIAYASGLRSGIELSYSQSDVNTHTDVTLAGGAIGALDAAALTGGDDPLGVTIADVVADGQGDLDQFALFANAYYDFNREGFISPYVGAGVGVAFVDVNYSPSAVGIIDENETAFAYQGKAGATVNLSERMGVFSEYTYRATTDIETDNTLFPGTLDIDNRQHLISAGIRYTFG